MSMFGCPRITTLHKKTHLQLKIPIPMPLGGLDVIVLVPGDDHF